MPRADPDVDGVDGGREAAVFDSAVPFDQKARSCSTPTRDPDVGVDCFDCALPRPDYEDGRHVHLRLPFDAGAADVGAVRR